MPAILSATPPAELVHTITIVAAEDRSGVNVAAVFRPNEIRGVKYNDLNGNHIRDVGEPGMPGITIFIDLNRNNMLDAGEPTTVSGPDGSYAFTNMSPGNVGYDRRADWNSDGSVNGGDLPMFAANFNQSLPASEPNALSFPPPLMTKAESSLASLADAFFGQLDNENDLLKNRSLRENHHDRRRH